MTEQVDYFEEDAKLDSVLIHAAMTGGDEKFMFAARAFFDNPSDAVRRSLWLTKQPQSYTDQVIAEVKLIQDLEAARAAEE